MSKVVVAAIKCHFRMDHNEPLSALHCHYWDSHRYLGSQPTSLHQCTRLPLQDFWGENKPHLWGVLLWMSSKCSWMLCDFLSNISWFYKPINHKTLLGKKKESIMRVLYILPGKMYFHICNFTWCFQGLGSVHFMIIVMNYSGQ